MGVKEHGEGDHSRQKDPHHQRHSDVNSALHERRPTRSPVWPEQRGAERGVCKGKMGPRSIFLLWNSCLGPSGPSGWPGSQCYSTIILLQRPAHLPLPTDGFMTLILTLGQTGHMAGLPQRRNLLSHLPWVLFVFSSMWLLIGFTFWSTVSVRKRWLGNKYLRDSWFQMNAFF